MEHSLSSRRPSHATSLTATLPSGEHQLEVDDRDADHLVSIGLVVRGKYRDIQRIRDMILEKAACTELMRVIYGTISSYPLYIIKGTEWRVLKDLENQSGGE